MTLAFSFSGNSAVPLPREKGDLANISKTQLLELRDFFKSEWQTVIPVLALSKDCLERRHKLVTMSASLWRCILKSSRDNWLLKKVYGRYERCILQCVTPWTFWQKSLPLDIGRNFDQKLQKKLLFWVFRWTFLF